MFCDLISGEEVKAGASTCVTPSMCSGPAEPRGARGILSRPAGSFQRGGGTQSALLSRVAAASRRARLRGAGGQALLVFGVRARCALPTPVLAPSAFSGETGKKQCGLDGHFPFLIVTYSDNNKDLPLKISKCKTRNIQIQLRQEVSQKRKVASGRLWG